jgi:hypothetical protein
MTAENKYCKNIYDKNFVVPIEELRIIEISEIIAYNHDL